MTGEGVRDTFWTKEPPPEEAKRMRRKSSGGAAVDREGSQGYLLDEGTSAGRSEADEEEKFRRGLRLTGEEMRNKNY